jgi:hypothetical protein
MIDLQEEIAFLVGHNTKASLRATVKTAVKVNWRKRRLERMQGDLADSEQIMQSALLAWILYVNVRPVTNKSPRAATPSGATACQLKKEMTETAIFAASSMTHAHMVALGLFHIIHCFVIPSQEC